MYSSVGHLKQWCYILHLFTAFLNHTETTQLCVSRKIKLLQLNKQKQQQHPLSQESQVYNKLSCSLLCNYCLVSQIGRSTESPIDFVVTDTIAGGQESEETPITQSTISRFACRVVCERNPPFTARIYAAGFDSSKNIFLGVITSQPLPNHTAVSFDLSVSLSRYALVS